MTTATITLEQILDAEAVWRAAEAVERAACYADDDQDFRPYYRLLAAEAAHNALKYGYAAQEGLTIIETRARIERARAARQRATA